MEYFVAIRVCLEALPIAVPDTRPLWAAGRLVRRSSNPGHGLALVTEGAGSGRGGGVPDR